MSKRVKISPLFTTSKDIAAFWTELAASQIHPLYELCNTGTKIMCSTEAEYRAIGAHLVVKQYEFYTQGAPGSEPLKVILRGLPEVTIVELQAAILLPAIRNFSFAGPQ